MTDFRDPNLQTGPFPQWPTLPVMPQQAAPRLENDTTAWEGGDFPTHPDPFWLVVSLLGARAGKARSIMKDPGITGGMNLDQLVRQYGENADVSMPAYRNSATGLSLGQPGIARADWPLPYMARSRHGMPPPANDVLSPYDRALLEQLTKQKPPEDKE